MIFDYDDNGDHLCDGGVPKADWLNNHHVKLHLHLMIMMIMMMIMTMLMLTTLMTMMMITNI